jgi:hypothetical protein
MNANELAVVQRRFESPDEVRSLEKGKPRPWPSTTAP